MIGAFPWSSKGITSKMPWLWIPSMGKLDKKAVFPQHGENTAFLSNFSADGLHDWDIFEQLDIWLCHSTCLFHLYTRWKYSLFSSFPLGGLHGWGILLVIPLELQGKRHQPFSMAQPILLVIPFKLQGKRHQPFSMTQPNKTTKSL